MSARKFSLGDLVFFNDCLGKINHGPIGIVVKIYYSVPDKRFFHDVFFTDVGTVETGYTNGSLEKLDEA